MAIAGKLSLEVPVKASAANFFNLFAKQLHHIQNVCERVHGTKLHQGDWHAPGSDSVKHWTYVIDGKVVTCKETIDSVDEQNKSMTFNLFDGDISQSYKVFKLSVQAVDKAGGGAIIKWGVEYQKVNENVEAPYGYMEYFDKCTVEIDGHLIKA